MPVRHKSRITSPRGRLLAYPLTGAMATSALTAVSSVSKQRTRRLTRNGRAWFMSAGIAVGQRCAHGVDRNPRYEAREEEPGGTNLDRKCARERLPRHD